MQITWNFKQYYTYILVFSSYLCYLFVILTLMLKNPFQGCLICLSSNKSQYFAINEVNNSFIIQSPSLISYLNHALTDQESDLPLFTQERGYNWAEYYLLQNTFRQCYAIWTLSLCNYLYAVICESHRGLFANEKEEICIEW